MLFFMNCLNSHVYEAKSRTLKELKEEIMQEIIRINRDPLERVEINFQEQLQQCID